MSGIQNPAPLSPTGGRLTTTTGTPVDTTDRTAQSTIYWTPYSETGNGDRVILFDSAGNPYPVEYTEKSIGTTKTSSGTTTNGNKIISALTDTSQLVGGMEITGTNVGAASVIATIDSATQVTGTVNSTGSATNTMTFKIPANTLYDILAIASGSTIALRFSTLWTSSTYGASTRADAVSLNRGVPVITADKTKLVLGTGMTGSTAGLFDFQNQAATTKQARALVNVYNKVFMTATYSEATVHGYAAGGAIREWNGATDLHYLPIIAPLATRGIIVLLGRAIDTAGAIQAICSWGLNSRTLSTVQVASANIYDAQQANINSANLVAGYNRLYLTEFNAASITVSYIQNITRGILQV
jgi:hypothetical protein